MNLASDQQKTVYVVDDDEAVRESLGALLVSAGLETRKFATGSEILGSLRSVTNGCVLLDVCLPDHDGFEVLSRMRTAGVRVPVILMSGHEHLIKRVQALVPDAFAVLEKPIPDNVLLETIGEAVGTDLNLPSD